MESAWPYSPVQVTPWTPPTITTPPHKSTMVTGAVDYDDIIANLDNGTPIILGLIITDAFYQPTVDGTIEDQTPDLERGGHAVLAVGHGLDGQGGTAILVRNSWGANWGVGGYGWLPRSYVERQLYETALLT
ncbi:MAG: hypothetical protein DHS20C03_08740 [Minwuia thermotolerans]|nr:MAG: hypothetical protein DHS20C03_08740 [Minwuia thermotolerans]